MSRAARLDLVEATVLTSGGRCILDTVSLSVEPGERLAVVGPNGAGKTTMLRLILGRLVPTAGRVRLDGIEVGALPPAERARRIASVVQNDTPDPRLTVLDYVGLGRIPHEGRVPAAAHRHAVGAATERVGLDGLGRRRLETLSGGERQRAAIARAIAQDPALLVLDEPTNHLDPRARFDILGLARDLGVTVVAVLHDLALIAPFADRVAVLKDGCLVALDEPARALAPAVVRSVFAMDCFPVVSPVSGRDIIVFDVPRPALPMPREALR